MYRPKQWRRTERKREKLEKKKSWYKTNGNESVIFIPYTQGGRLKKLYEDEIRKSPFKVKVTEKTGRKLKDIIHKKDPFKKTTCERNNCFVCTTGGKGNCTKENITYSITCKENCNQRDIYCGETSYNTFTRGDEHLRKYENKSTNSMLIEHSNIYHNGDRIQYQMDITGYYHHDSTKRQVTEGLHIEQTPRERLMNSKSEWNTPNMPSCSVTRLSER